jgi:hypothetical protein
MLDGHNSAELTNLIGSGNPNRDALQYINPEIAQNPRGVSRPRNKRGWKCCAIWTAINAACCRASGPK